MKDAEPRHPEDLSRRADLNCRPLAPQATANRSATAVGVQVGDPEEHAKQAYGSRLKIAPHHYTDGHYLTLRSQSGGNGIRFETEKGKIERFYAGTFEAIQYVEGCQ